VSPLADHQPVRIAAAQLSLQIADLAANRAAAAAAMMKRREVAWERIK